MRKLSRAIPLNRADRAAAVVPVALLVIVTAAAIGFLILTNRYPTSPDSIGYIYAGLQLAKGEGLSHYDALNRDVAPFFYLHSFRAIEAGSPRAWFGYSPGYPILIAFAVVASGNIQSAFYATSLLPPLALIVTYYLGRGSGLSRWTSLAATLVLAAAVSFWRFGTEPWSELPSLVAISIGALAFFASRDRQRARGQQAWWAVFAGLMFGYALLIRPTNLILVGPALVLTDFALIYPRLTLVPFLRTGWGTYAVIGLFAAITLIYNWLALGGPLNNIYSTPELGAYPWSLFSLSYALGDSPIGSASLTHSLATLWENFSFLLPFALLGWWRMGRTDGLFSAALTLSTVALYSVYAFPPQGVNARFLLPAFPFIAVGIARGVHTTWTYLPVPVLKATAPVALVALLLLLWHPTLAELDERNKTASLSVAAIRDLVVTSPSDSVWLSANYNDIINFYGSRATLNYRRALQAGSGSDAFDVSSMEGCVADAISIMLRRGIPIYFIPESGWVSIGFWMTILPLKLAMAATCLFVQT